MEQNELKTIYSNNIKAIKKELRRTTKELSDKLGVSKRALDSYEQGLCIPTGQLITAMHQKLNVNLNWFCTGVGEMFVNNQTPEDKEKIRGIFNDLLKEHGLI